MEKIIHFDNFTDYVAVNIDINPAIKVGVECRTYNQKDYIKDALEGIIMQKTNFQFSVLIIDDASSDGTQDIIRQYVNAYPDKVMALFAKKNVFGKKGTRNIYNILFKRFIGNAKYIATCEGDDYWTCPDKLQIQADYMDSHMECEMYFHNSIWLDCKKNEKILANPFECEGERDLSIEEMILIKKGHPATASRMYRPDLFSVPTFVTNSSVGDYPLMLYASTKGSIHYSSKNMCTYRYLRSGSTTDMSLNEKENNYSLYHRLGLISFLLEYDRYTLYQFHITVSRMAMGFLFETIKNRSSVYTKEIDLDRAIMPYCLPQLSIYKDYISEKALQLISKGFMGDHLKKYIEDQKHIVIFGTGEYAKHLTTQLKRNEIEIDGYVKTATEENETEFLKKPLWNLKSLPDEYRQTGILIGTLPRTGDGIDDSLLEAGISNYFYVYGFNIHEIVGVSNGK